MQVVRSSNTRKRPRADLSLDDDDAPIDEEMLKRARMALEGVGELHVCKMSCVCDSPYTLDVQVADCMHTPAHV